ncbi:MAG: hypothetical protein U5R06_19980 [candidate division KSB1 bacterium]|nr:hypothetical protein [candidate division KSB1 bacterium]
MFDLSRIIQFGIQISRQFDSIALYCRERNMYSLFRAYSTPAACDKCLFRSGSGSIDADWNCGPAQSTCKNEFLELAEKQVSCSLYFRLTFPLLVQMENSLKTIRGFSCVCISI